MLGHLLRRVGASALTLVLVAVVVFLAVDVLPGDPARLVVGLEASPEEYRAARERLGLDDPWLVRLGRWAMGFLVGDWGNPFATGSRPGSSSLGPSPSPPPGRPRPGPCPGRCVPLGSSRRPAGRGWTDLATVGFAQLGTALPEFWLGVLLVGLFAVGLRWLPAGGFPGWAAADPWRYLLLPAVALALPGGVPRPPRPGFRGRRSRGGLHPSREGQGVAGWRVLGVHALRNALIPVVTGAGLTLVRLLAGAMVVENVFGLPGLGRLAVVAAGERDLPCSPPSQSSSGRS